MNHRDSLSHPEDTVTAGRTLLADFLRARRELLQPEQVGLPRDQARRVPGLRREEVARLAGISPEYYLRLEQGRDHQPSEQVLASLSRALQLDADAHTYLHRLAHPSAGFRRTPPQNRVSDDVLRILDLWSHTPAYVTDRNHDILAVNPLARAVSPGVIEPGNNLLVTAFERGAHAQFPEGFAEVAGRMVSALRFHADPLDPRLQEIVGRLSVQHREFRRMWALHDARPQTSGVLSSHIEPFGWVELHWQTLEVPGDGAHFVTAMFGEPGTPGAAALESLAGRVAAGSQLARAV
jgi:transcriptional regulator with XRE-family HTH domain